MDKSNSKERENLSNLGELNVLPIELIKKIFYYIPSWQLNDLMLVCKTIKNLIYTNIKDYYLKNYPTDFTFWNSLLQKFSFKEEQTLEIWNMLFEINQRLPANFINDLFAKEYTYGLCSSHLNDNFNLIERNGLETVMAIRNFQFLNLFAPEELTKLYDKIKLKTNLLKKAILSRQSWEFIYDNFIKPEIEKENSTQQRDKIINEAFALAIDYDHYLIIHDLIELIIKYNINIQPNSLHNAFQNCSYFSIFIMNLIAKNYLDLNNEIPVSERKSLLYYIFYHSRLNFLLLKTLLLTGADTNLIYNILSKTDHPKNEEIIKNSNPLKMAKLLIENNIDINAGYKILDDTILHKLIFDLYSEYSSIAKQIKLDKLKSIVKFFSCTDIINLQNNDSDTAFHMAIKYQLKNLYPCFLNDKNHITNLDLKNKDGKTLLMLAVDNCDLELIELLIKNNANFSIKYEKENIFDYAFSKYGNTSLRKNMNLEFLEKFRQLLTEKQFDFNTNTNKKAENKVHFYCRPS
jgi:ankyrin repeat protein